MSQQSCARCEHPSTCACQPHLTTAQATARQRFDLERCLASLPPAPQQPLAPHGAAGMRLRGHLNATISDDLLREFANEILGAARIGEPYLDALRVVLGNQAEADRKGYTLEMNIRTDFASEWIMRNIINQMSKAGLTQGMRVSLGNGKTQVVQCYHPQHDQAFRAAQDLNAMLRAEEDRCEAGRSSKAWGACPAMAISADEVPF